MSKNRRRRAGIPRTKFKPAINIGCGFDIPTGLFVKGSKGEIIIDGGLSDFTAVVGAGNSFKSLLLQYFAMSAANTIAATDEPYIMNYDTENNAQPSRLDKLASKFEFLPNPATDEDTGVIDLSDKSMIAGDAWWSKVKEFLGENSKDGKLKYTGFTTKGKVHTDHAPTIVINDSFSKFEPKSTEDMLAKSKSEDGSTNTYYMRTGLFKAKVLGEIPPLSSKSNMYFLTTAHLGIKSAIGENKYSKPGKKLFSLKDDEEIKKVSPEFYYLVKTLWKVISRRVLKNPATGEALYPLRGDSGQATDLNLVTVESLRLKTGATGIKLEVVVSQDSGVLPALTNFHYIKTNKFGFAGNNTTYNLVLYPNERLQRTNIRPKTDKDVKLCRAIELTSDLLQIKTYHPAVVRTGLWCEPEVLYKDIVDMGYDWDDLLNTRGWYAIDQYNKDVRPFMSIMDLLEFRKGAKTPYWMDKKTKKEKKWLIV